VQVAVGNGSVVFVLSYISKPAFQGDSLIVVRTVGNAFSRVPVDSVVCLSVDVDVDVEYDQTKLEYEPATLFLNKSQPHSNLVLRKLTEDLISDCIFPAFRDSHQFFSSIPARQGYTAAHHGIPSCAALET